MSEIEAVDLDTKRVHIPRPERYWMATAELFPVMIGPDLDDGRQRPAGRDDIRWNEIGRMITGISHPELRQVRRWLERAVQASTNICADDFEK